MGGNALSRPSVRLEKSAYDMVSTKIIADLHHAYPDLRIARIESYASKDSYGDCDILMQSSPGYLPDDVGKVIGAVEMVRNGNITSYGVMVDGDMFQIDIISTPIDEFDFAKVYFDYNDLGNLMGRVFKKLGMKYGHRGLYYVLRDGTRVIAEILVSRDIEKVMQFGGFSYERYCRGFDTLDDVFDFVTSSAYFRPSIYMYDNMNHRSRVRDRKRKTYSAFVDHVTGMPEPDISEFPDEDEFLYDAFEIWPLFFGAYAGAILNNQRDKAYKKHFGGDVVMGLTGLSGKELGKFMAILRDNYAHLPTIALMQLDTNGIILKHYDEFKGIHNATTE